MRLRPTARLLAFGLLCVPFAVLGITLPLLAFFAENMGSRIGFLILGPLLAALSLPGVYGAFIVRTRFNDAGIEQRNLTRRVTIAWADVREIKASVSSGAYIVSTQGPLIVWRAFRGYHELIAEATRHGVEIDPALLPGPGGE